MYPGTYAAEAPGRIAAAMAGTGETLSYFELERRSAQLARVLHAAGLRPGDAVALLTENSLRAFEVYWAAMRSGLYITAVNCRLKPDEVAYIVNNCGAAALIVSSEQAATAEAVAGLTAEVKLRLAFGGPVIGHGGYEVPGTAGRTVMGVVRICADDGAELPAGQIGVVYFERDAVPFAYHHDPQETRAAQHPEQPTWTTLGDIGYLDGDGFLFLTDRRAFTIISGGVNIYPQEAENVLALHPAVYDVAVIGVPDPDMGESVAAIIQPAAGTVRGPELEREIIAFVKSKIASFKAPRIVHFVDELPRTEAGKLMKAELKAKYANA